MFPRAATCSLLVAACLLASCKDREIATYRAPKDPAPTMPMPGSAAPAAGDSMAATAVPTGSDSLSWTAPASWTAKAPGAMRKGSFSVKGDGGAEADLSITAFPGDTGGLLANLNRWRGQVSLPPLAEGQLDGVIEHLDADTLHFEIVDFVGSAKGAPTRLLGAVLSRPGETWFFKLMGPDALVAAQKNEFETFLRSVKESAK
jgi:hypothetical protein